MSKEKTGRTAAIKLGKLQQEFESRCEIENLTPSELLRKALLQYLNGTVEHPSEQVRQIPAKVENKHDFSEKKKVVVSFSESEFQALQKLAESAYKPTYQGVLISMFRAQIMQDPYLNAEEILLLKDANKQLLAIGRNLNQIVRAIHSGDYGNRDILDGGYLEKLLTACDRHADYFQHLINRATLRRKVKAE